MCGCHFEEKSFAQSGLPRDPAAYFPKDTLAPANDAGNQSLAQDAGWNGPWRTTASDAGNQSLAPGAGAAAPRGSGDIDLISHTTGRNIGESSARVLVIVNGDPIVETELNHAMFPAQMVTATDAETAARLASYKKGFLERLIDVEILTQDMRIRFGKTPGGKRTIEKLKEMSEREFETVSKTQIKEMNLHSEEEYKELLRSAGLTFDGRRDFIQKSIIADEYMHYLVSVRVEEPGQRQIEEYYREHEDEFRPQTDIYEWEDIFLDFSKYPEPQKENARARANDLGNRMRAGAKIADLLQFDDGDSRSRGGRGQGTHRGQIQPPEIEPALVNLKEGEVGPLVIMQTGIHVVRMVHRENAHELHPFDAQTQKMIKDKIRQDLMLRERKRVMEELRREAQVQYLIETDRK
jgi:hypothetical protein